MGEGPTDWLDVQRRLLEGDRLACLELGRLVTSVLQQLRAFDFEQEWDDLRQEVLVAVLANARQGRLRDPRAFVGYVRVITRNKFVDRLKRRLRWREREALPWDDETAHAVIDDLGGDPDDQQALWREVDRLPEPERGLVRGIYGEGHTYREMAERSGIPLGSLKRKLRGALAMLRERLEGQVGASAEVGDGR